MVYRLAVAEKRRQALTQARRRGPIRSWGEPGYAERLVKALSIAEDEPRGLTHGFHPYAARMHPLTARRAIEALRLGKRDFLFDPFCGSGTVLVEGLRAGIASAGLDLSPLAVLISKARTWGAPAAARRELVTRARTIAEGVLAEGKAARRAGAEATAHRKLTPTQKKVLTGKFEPHVHRELEALAAGVDGVKGDLADILRAVLSSIVMKFARGAGFGRGMAARLFATRAGELAAGLDALWREVPAGTTPPIIIQADARQYGGDQDRVFDAIVTSPPYPGTYDYAEQHEIPLALLGMLSSSFVRSELGARRKFEDDTDKAIFHWEQDFLKILKQLVRMLRPKSKVVLLMGDSIAGKGPKARVVYVEKTVGRLTLEAGLAPLAGAAAERDKLGNFEVKAFGKEPKLEHLVMFVVE